MQQPACTSEPLFIEDDIGSDTPLPIFVTRTTFRRLFQDKRFESVANLDVRDTEPNNEGPQLFDSYLHKS